MQNVGDDKMMERMGIFAFIQSRMIDSLRYFISDDNVSRLEIDNIILEHNRIIPNTEPEWMIDYIVAGSVVELLEEVRDEYLSASSDKKLEFLGQLESSLTKMDKSYYEFGAKIRDTGIFNMDILHDSMKDALGGAKECMLVK